MFKLWIHPLYNYFLLHSYFYLPILVISVMSFRSPTHVKIRFWKLENFLWTKPVCKWDESTVSLVVIAL